VGRVKFWDKNGELITNPKFVSEDWKYTFKYPICIKIERLHCDYVLPKL
jgi:hypothetical protein